MDIDAAIRAHISWKIKLHAYACGTSKAKLNAETVCKDDICAFGQWIYGEGKVVLAQAPEQYQELIRLHAEFHRNAAALITMIENGQAAEVHAALCDEESSYNQISLEVVSLLVQVKSEGAENASRAAGMHAPGEDSAFEDQVTELMLLVLAAMCDYAFKHEELDHRLAVHALGELLVMVSQEVLGSDSARNYLLELAAGLSPRGNLQ